MESVIENTTGVYFFEQNVSSITDAVNIFENKYNTFDHTVIASHAAGFSAQRFKNEFTNFLSQITSPDQY